MSEQNRILTGLPLMLLDFEALYAADPEMAIRRLLLLLLDERACQTRVVYLSHLKAESESANRSREEVGLFDEEIRLICGDGLFATWEAGRLTPAVVSRLQRLTCDPEALLEAHRKLAETVDEDNPAKASRDVIAAN